MWSNTPLDRYHSKADGLHFDNSNTHQPKEHSFLSKGTQGEMMSKKRRSFTFALKARLANTKASWKLLEKRSEQAFSIWSGWKKCFKRTRRLLAEPAETCYRCRPDPWNWATCQVAEDLRRATDWIHVSCPYCTVGQGREFKNIQIAEWQKKRRKANEGYGGEGRAREERNVQRSLAVKVYHGAIVLAFAQRCLFFWIHMFQIHFKRIGYLLKIRKNSNQIPGQYGLRTTPGHHGRDACLAHTNWPKSQTCFGFPKVWSILSFFPFSLFSFRFLVCAFSLSRFPRVSIC